MSVNFIAVRDNLLVKIEKVERKTASGIILPDSEVEETVKFASVVSYGEKCDLAHNFDKLVVITKYAGIQVELEGVNYLIIKESDILGFVNK